MTQLTAIKKDWKTVFFENLSKSPNVSKAAKAAGYTRQWVYHLRNEDPEFAKLWDDALAQSLDTAEGEMYRRAVRGVVKKVFYQGTHIDTVKEYSDTLLIFLLKAHKPEVYREVTRNELTGKNGGPITHKDVTELTDDELARIAAGSSGGATKT